MRKSLFVAFVISLWLVAPYPTEACRIIPEPPEPAVIAPQPLHPIQVQSHRVATAIKNGVALTVLETVFYNPNPRVLEGTYIFPLPRGASISQFSMWIDGKEMPAELLDANKARDLYVSIVQRMVDPGLLEFVGRETFKLRIFPIPAQGTKKIKLSYEEILSVDGNLMRYVYPLTTVGNGREDVLGEVSLEVKVTSDIPVKSVFSPTHNVKVVKENQSATVNFDGKNVNPDRDFVLYVSRSGKKIDLSFVPFCKEAEDGYFLLMLSPESRVAPEETNPKDVVFVLDTSGSMVGKKMDQARETLKYCINMLRPEDRFNIVPFATEASTYQDSLVDASPANIQKALSFVEKDVYARGGTNIEEALGFALAMYPKAQNRPYLVIFLTDGQPTIGIVDHDEIIGRVKKAQCPNLRLFTFGIGNQINTKLLDRLAEENRGAREYVGEQEDIEIKVSAFFDKVASPVLSGIAIQFPSASNLRVSEVYPREIQDLFKGAHLTLLGRYSGKGDQAIRVSGTMAGKAQEFVYEVSFPEKNDDNDQIPRLWAVRKVGFLLDQIRLNGENDELKNEIVALARRFGIVTPYTSYLVVEDTPVATRPPTDGPRAMPLSPPGVFAGTADDADAEMDKSTGENAVETSRAIRQMRGAEVVGEEQDAKGRKKAQEQMRKIAEKTFYLHDNVWYDSRCDSVDLSKTEKTRVKYLSDEYLELLRKYPQMGKFLAVGRRLVLLWQGEIYEVY